MNRVTILCAILIGALFTVGCNEQKVPVSMSENTLVTPASLAKGPPPTSGPIVIRSQTLFAVFFVDLDKGISASIGADPVEFCSGIIDFDIVELQEISVPEDANRLIDLVKGSNVTASVWPFTTFDCDLFANTTPLATGTVKLVNTDNDLLIFLNPDHKNSNAFGFTAQGRLNRPDGTKASFNAVSKCVWDGDDIASLKCVEKINLN